MVLTGLMMLSYVIDARIIFEGCKEVGKKIKTLFGYNSDL